MYVCAEEALPLIFTDQVLTLFDQTSRFITVRNVRSGSACKRTHYSSNIHTIVEWVEQNKMHQTTGAFVKFVGGSNHNFYSQHIPGVTA
jgi:hypothetical protein